MLRHFIDSLLDTFDYALVKKAYSCEIGELELFKEEGFLDIYKKSKDFTMTSRERMYGLYKAVEYVAKHQIPGDIVECGVWKGGSSMISALTLTKFKDTERKIYLYDTYSGMSEPTAKDRDYGNKPAIDAMKALGIKEMSEMCYVTLEEVKANMLSTGYPAEKILFIQGKVEDTIPKVVPAQISILRLDTDWYESTYHELVYLFPKLSVNGVIIIDDYGHWKGAKEATDKYFDENGIKILLNRIDQTGRIGIKS